MPSHDFKLRVVAIDDDEQHLKFIATSLSRENVVVSTSGSPRDGLELVRKEHPHLVLSDLMMPEMSGMDLLERILEFDPGTEIILLTGQYSTESAVEAIQKGAADYREAWNEFYYGKDGKDSKGTVKRGFFNFYPAESVKTGASAHIH